MEPWAAFTALCGVLLFILKIWTAGKPERDEKHDEKEKMQGRQDIVDGDAAAVSQRLNKLLSKSDSPSRSKDGKDNQGNGGTL